MATTTKQKRIAYLEQQLRDITATNDRGARRERDLEKDNERLDAENRKLWDEIKKRDGKIEKLQRELLHAVMSTARWRKAVHALSEDEPTCTQGFAPSRVRSI